MNTRSISNNLILSFIGIAFSLTSLGAPTSYPLKCRGTKTGEIIYEFSATVASFGFKKATTAGKDSLKPGECAWMDRALSNSEPSTIVNYPFAPKNKFSSSIRFGYTNGMGLMVAPLIGIHDTEIQWLKDLMSPDKYWLFQVYNDNGGHLIVTDSKPSL